MNFATGLEGFVMLLRWLRVDYIQDEIPGKQRWFQWGYVLRNRNDPKPEWWYILVKLPSYFVGYDIVSDRHDVWHQRTLIFRGQLPVGS